MKYALVCTLILFMFTACREPKSPVVTNAPGFRVIHAVDSSRIYKPNSPTSDYLHFRPLDIDLWYPAQANDKDSILTFGDVFGLLESRANYYTASTVGKGITNKYAASFCEGFKCSQPETLLRFKTSTRRNAAATPGRFPLILYLASYNGMSYENTALLERLASQGYIIASISSIGSWPGDMTMKRKDLMEQVRDAAFALTLLKQRADIDSTRIGVVGYSWGGLAGAVLAANRTDIDALVSLDGSEFHQYGTDKQEDADFDETKNALPNRSISTPYLRLESGRDKAIRLKQVYNFSEKLSKPGRIFNVDSAAHEDFGHIPTLVRQSGGCATTRTYDVIGKLTTAFLADYLTGKTGQFDTSLKAELNNTVRLRL